MQRNLNKVYKYDRPGVLAGSGWTAANKRWGAGALIFDGSSDYVTAGSDASLSFTTGDFTFESWIKTSSNASMYIFGKYKNTNVGGYELYMSTGNIRCYMQDTGVANYYDLKSSKTYNDGFWHYVSYVRTGTTMNMYIDGVKDTGTLISVAGTVNNVVCTVTCNLTFGSSSDNALYFNGAIDSTRIYSRPLTPQEIMSNYNAGNVELQTRVGATTDPNDGAWEAWKPTTSETQIDSLDGSYQYNTTDTGLLSYWPMDDAPGATVSDIKGANTGTATGTTVVNGKWNNGRGFNGTSDTISVANEANFDFERTNSFSIETWIKTTSAGQDIFTKMANAAPFTGFEVYLSGGMVGSYLISTWSTNVLQVHAARTINDGNWHHIVVTYGGTSTPAGYAIYIDGVSQAIVTDLNTLSATVLNNISPYIGSRNGAGAIGFVKGMLDEIRVYNTAITAATVQQHFTEGSTNANFFDPSPDTVTKMEGSVSEKITAGVPQLDSYTAGLWHFDETGGTTSYLKDSSSNANNGTPTGTTVTNGIAGKARNYNGTSDTVSVGNPASLQITGALTLDAWINTTTAAGSYRGIIGKMGTGGTFFYSGYTKER